MDISSTTSSVSTSQSTTNTTTTTSSKTSDSENSFKSEMNKVSDESKTAEKDTVTTGENTAKNTDESVNNSNQEAKETTQSGKTTTVVLDKDSELQNFANGNFALSGEIDFNNFQTTADGIIQNNALNVQDVLLNANKQLADIAVMTEVPSKVDYTKVQMSYDDAAFFADLVQDTDKTLQTVVTDIQNNTVSEKVAQHVKVSATLMTALSEAVKNNQPFRIDFDKDISVIIKVERDGSLSAKFIPGDRAVEQYLRHNISMLQQRFDEQELSYKELTYTRQQRNRQQQERRNNKEND